MESFIGGLIGGMAVIVYMLFRINRVLIAESNSFRKDARSAQAQADKLANELEKQKIINSSPKITPFPASSGGAEKARYARLKGEYDSLKNEQQLAVDALNRIRNEVDKSENMPSSLAIKIRAYLTTVVGIAS
ncbi:MAG: hypothetical protein OEX07_16620 [Gammaproteobacteria bacterium]|nr:hypothetical protein [Gammaproteobacteria bacterium]